MTGKTNLQLGNEAWQIIDTPRYIKTTNSQWTTAMRLKRLVRITHILIKTLKSRIELLVTTLLLAIVGDNGSGFSLIKQLRRNVNTFVANNLKDL